MLVTFILGFKEHHWLEKHHIQARIEATKLPIIWQPYAG